MVEGSIKTKKDQVPKEEEARTAWVIRKTPWCYRIMFLNNVLNFFKKL